MLKDDLTGLIIKVTDFADYVLYRTMEDMNAYRTNESALYAICQFLNYVFFEHYEKYQITSIYDLNRNMFQEFILDYCSTRKPDGSYPGKEKVLKMLLDGYSRRDIAATLGVSPKSITKCKKIIDQNSITAEMFSQISEEQIMAMIPQRKAEYDTKALKPDVKTIHIALVNGESLASLFEKYTCQCKVNGEKALKQSRFYKLVKDYEITAKATSDNNLRPGSIMYVAWFPSKIQIADYETGEILSASVLYGILPYSKQLVLACAREKNANALVEALNAFFVRLNGIPKCLIIEKGTSTYCKIQGVRQLQPQLSHMLDYYGMAVAENKLSDIVKTEILTRVKSVEKELFT